MIHQLSVPPLVGVHVRLEPLSEEHIQALTAAAIEDRSSYRFTVVPRDVEDTTRQVRDLLDEWALGEIVPFAQIAVASGRAVGITRYMTVRAKGHSSVPYAVEIGGTWLSASAQRTSINTEAKLLLLTHAFSTWRVARVDLKTDSRNERSRSAILRLGATFEGVLRQWQPSMVSGEESLYRDTAMYSIVAAQWPELRERLAGMVR